MYRSLIAASLFALSFGASAGSPISDVAVAGRIHLDFAAFDNDTANNASGAEFRRLRFALTGKVKGWSFKFAPDFSDDEVTLKNAYIRNKIGKIGKLYIGQFKQPFGLEELSSSNHIPNQERSSASKIAVAHQIGIGIFGSADNMTWAGSFYSLDDNDANVSDGLGLGARFTATPINTGSSIVHLGIAAAAEQYGRNGEDPDEFDRFRIRVRPAGHLSDASRTTLINLNNDQRSDVYKVGLEAALISGPLTLSAEWALADAEDDTEQGEVHAYYLNAAYSLTGEQRAYRGKKGSLGAITPARKSGAWEVVARFDEARGEQQPLQGALSNDIKVRSISAGVNWHLSQNLRFMLTGWDAKITNELTGQVVDEPRAVTGRVQFTF